MKLKSFRVTKFRNIIDSGEVKIDDRVTCLVGKNEAGKSGILEALYLFNPAYDEKFKVDEQYPRWIMMRDRKAGNLDEYAPITCSFQLEDPEITAVHGILGSDVIEGNELEVQRQYGGSTVWSFKWSKRNAARNLISGFPASVAKMLSESDTIEACIERLEELKPVDGVEEGPTKEDIAAAKTIVAQKGFAKLSAWNQIVNGLKPFLPKLFRFTNYNTLPGRIDIAELAKKENEGPGKTGMQTARALVKLAGTDPQQLADDNYELRKGELEAVQIELTQQVFEYWKQNPDLEVNIDVDRETVRHGNGTMAVSRYLDIRLRDKRSGYSNNFSQRSSGFQWFFSFLSAFSEFEGRGSTIILLDEPALTLHGKAQADFLRFINERLAPGSPVIYTTHSPFMVEADKLGRVRIVEDNGPPTGSVVTSEALAANKDSLFPLQAALGYDIAQSLFIGPNNLVVEGTSEYIYLTIMSLLCKTNGRMALDQRWRILPAGGSANIPTFVSLVGPHLDVTVFADSDTKGMQRIQGMVADKLFKGSRLIRANDALGNSNADTEDLFDAADYLGIFNETYATTLGINDLPAGDRIVKRIEAKLGKSYIHGEVAETFLRNHGKISVSQVSLDRFSGLFASINATLGV